VRQGAADEVTSQDSPSDVAPAAEAWALGRKRDMIRLSGILLILSLGACRDRAQEQASIDTMMVYVAPPPAAPGAPELRVAVLPDATVHVDDQLVTLVALDSLLDQLQAKQGHVWLYHDRAAVVRGSRADSVWRKVGFAIARRGLSNSFARRADFSDVERR
jgi:hypothetical protein